MAGWQIGRLGGLAEGGQSDGLGSAGNLEVCGLWTDPAPIDVSKLVCAFG